MKVLVTGYRGFIGQNMVEALERAGHQVYGYNWGEELPPDHKLREMERVIHLGAISSTTSSDVNRVMTQNYDFTLKLLIKCENFGVNVQYASSASIYGKGSDFREKADPDPRSPYAWSKYLVDRYVLMHKWKNIVQGFRYFNVYGPHEEHKDQPSPFTAFRKQARETGVIKVFEDSDKIFRDFVPVETVISYHLKFFEIRESGIWNIGTGAARSFQSVAEEVAAETGAKIEVVPMPEKLKASYQWHTEADLTQLNKTVSGLWKPW